ncbi:MAG: hypothetical protein Q9183_003056 [Haloplaca sp. 2 TL-2023]
MSMVQTYQPPLMEIGQDVIPELQPVFSFLNSHSNKLFQEGYFLKLNDLDSHGRPNSDRTWTEVFAQLVGTILSLWDAAELDTAGKDGEVAPKFINLADASIKMIETLPTRNQGAEPLQNVLSISTAGKNRYLFHFNSLHSLTQWTAGIRLAMFEHVTLQEAYTGSLVAGKGKLLNNIKVIMERIRFKHEDWARVRFGAGTPWRRCWCIISPPDEKEVQQQQKSLKKKSAYDRNVPVLKGTVKFYDTKKITKKTRPIATINDAYSAYAIYPQSKPLIDQSTLVKVEGNITIHSSPESTTEGFVFVMPEVHPAITGFEMMLRWLMPVYDVYGLYGRPNRLIADVHDVRSLMFAMPQTRRYGFLDILDVAQLVHEPGSHSWSEKEWRSRLKELTASRQTMTQANGGRPRSRASSLAGKRNSLPSRSGTLRFEDGASIKSAQDRPDVPPMPPPHRTGSAPPNGPFESPRANGHQRSVSEKIGFTTPKHRQLSKRNRTTDQNYSPSRPSYEQARPYTQDGPQSLTPSRVSFEKVRSDGNDAVPPMPPLHGMPVAAQATNPYVQRSLAESDSLRERSSSESENRMRSAMSSQPHLADQDLRPSSPPQPVVAPPTFTHQPGAKPQKRPALSPEMRRATSRMSITTLAQLAEAGQLSPNGSIAAAGAAAAWNADGQRRNGRASEDHGPRAVNHDASSNRANADRFAGLEGMVLGDRGRMPSESGAPHASDFGNYDYRHGSYAPSSAQDPLPLQRGPAPPPNFSKPGISQRPQASTSSPMPEDYQQYPMSARGQPDDGRPEMKRRSTSHSITRKPVPSRSPGRDSPKYPPADLPSPTGRSSLESLRRHVVDEDALARVRTFTMESHQTRRPSTEGSIYDDDSNVSPDYASTRKSTETKRSKPSMERPRAGVLKTVGTVAPEQKDVLVGDARYQSGLPRSEVSAGIPSVDFGPTLAYDPRKASRPSTSDALNSRGNESGTSSGRPTPSPEPSPRGYSPGDKQRSGSMPASRFANSPYERSPSRNLHTPEGHRRTPSTGSEADNARTVAWQPAASGHSPGSRQSITPEQFVQQRATTSRATPIYAHGRNKSALPSPSGSRQASGEVPTQQYGRQSPVQKDLPPRPTSRGASTLMNAASGDVSAHLSAREQEHVARATGSPLISMAANQPRPGQHAPGGGLVGAIEAREKEKREMREGVSSHMVQHAIAQRQQHAQAQQAQQAQQQQRQQSYANPSPQYQMPGAFPQTPQFSMPGSFPQTPSQHAPTSGQYPPSQGPGQQQYGHSAPQQRPQQWVSQAQRLYWGTPQQNTPSQHQIPQYQQHNPQQVQGQYGQGQHYQSHQQQYNQGQQQHYGPYFGNGQGGRQ